MNFSIIIFPTKFFRSLSTSSSSSFRQNLHKTQMSLQNLLKSGFTPTLQDLNHHLLFLSKSHRFKSTINFFHQMDSNHIECDSQTHSIFTWALLKSRNFEEAYDFMNTHMVKTLNSPKNRMWDYIIQGFCIVRDDPDKAVSVLRDCLRDYGMLPSSFTFRSLIHSFSSKGEMERAMEVLELMNDLKIRYPFDNFVCSSVISGFCKIGKPELAIEFFNNAESIGALRPNVVTYTALVSALCELGRFNEVDDLVCRMDSEGLVFDVVFYSSWILGYLKQGILDDGLLKYRQMVEKRIKPDNISYTVLIDGFSKEGNVEKSVGFLDKMEKEGLKPNLVTYTAVMLGFCKKGKLEEALAVFKMVEDLGIRVDEFTYATLIDGACRKGEFDCVFNLLDDMEKKEISPSIVTYNTVINGLCKFGRTSEADEVSKGIVADIITYSTLLHGYIEEENVLGILETKKRLEKAGVCMDVVMCNILVKALFMVGAFEDACTIYKEMPKMNLVADSVTYCTMIDGYCKVGRIDEALQIFDEFRRTSVSSGACYTCIIHGLCRNKMVDMAIEVFTELNEKGLVLGPGSYRMLIKAVFEEQSAQGVLNLVYRSENFVPEIYDIVCNDAICFLCKKGFFEAACNVYMTMRAKGAITTSKSYYAILGGVIGKGKEWINLPFLNIFVKEYGLVEHLVSKILLQYLCMKDVDNAISFLRYLKKTSTVTFPATIFKALTEDGRALDAYKVIMGAADNLPIIDVVHYSYVIHGLCKGGEPYKALDLCAFLKNKGISFNIITYNSIINGLCLQGCLVEAFRLFDSLPRVGLVPSEVTYAILIDNLCKEGFLLDATELFDRMVSKGVNPNTHIYNSLIDNYCKFGKMTDALKLLLHLEKRCLRPDEFTVSAVINGYCLKGDMEGALGFFFELKRKGTLPDFLGFLYLIRGLCSKGRMEEARSILREMLRIPFILELINQVNAVVQTESIESVLLFLCEQGSINEAVSILDEVKCMILPVGRGLRSFESQKPMECIEEDNLGTVPSKIISTTHKTDLDWGCVVKEVDKAVESCDKKRSQLFDFDVYYSQIASFCSRGELQKANRLLKEVLFQV